MGRSLGALLSRSRGEGRPRYFSNYAFWSNLIHPQDVSAACVEFLDRVKSNEGWVWTRAGDSASACRSCDAAAPVFRLGADDADLFTSRGAAMQMLGRRAEARADYERALVLDPGNEAARGNLLSLRSPH